MGLDPVRAVGSEEGMDKMTQVVIVPGQTVSMVSRDEATPAWRPTESRGLRKALAAVTALSGVCSANSMKAYPVCSCSCSCPLVPTCLLLYWFWLCLGGRPWAQLTSTRPASGSQPSGPLARSGRPEFLLFWFDHRDTLEHPQFPSVIFQ